MRLDGNTGTVVIEDAKIGASDVSGKLNVIDLSKGIVNFNLFSDNLDTADFATAKERKNSARMTTKAPLIKIPIKMAAKKASTQARPYEEEAAYRRSRAL